MRVVETDHNGFAVVDDFGRPVDTKLRDGTRAVAAGIEDRKDAAEVLKQLEGEGEDERTESGKRAETGGSNR